jgi:hypothetical protein
MVPFHAKFNENNVFFSLITCWNSSWNIYKLWQHYTQIRCPIPCACYNWERMFSYIAVWTMKLPLAPTFSLYVFDESSKKPDLSKLDWKTKEKTSLGSTSVWEFVSSSLWQHYTQIRCPIPCACYNWYHFVCRKENDSYKKGIIL